LKFNVCIEQLDESGQEFMSKSIHRIPSVMRCITRPVLSWFLNTTDINGLFHEGEMHVVSTPQIRRMLAHNRLLEAKQFTHLLDIGAGDGNVTVQLAPLAEEVTATEISAFMIRRLQRRGFRAVCTDTLDCAAIDEAAALTSLHSFHSSSSSREPAHEAASQSAGGSNSRTFDLIACMNVLDRCTHPQKLMSQLHARLDDAPHSRLVMAVVLPWRPTPQQETVSIRGRTWEDYLNSLLQFVETCGFQVESFSRVPYLSQGDFSQDLYVLDDALLVLSKIPK
jgi:2-polyprenyl-3-methyl-5-hydroxy-6-metoxy-1,4-benzoquinol methylase